MADPRAGGYDPAMSTPPNPRPTALVTGASSGIGLEIARELASSDHDVVLVARREDLLAAAASSIARHSGVRAVALPADLAEPDGAGRLVARLAAENIQVDVLVNNAGLGLYGAFVGSPIAGTLDTIQVNITSLTALTRLLLPQMLARRRGRILNVASTAAFQPGPLMAVYYATKAYVLSFSEALARELAGTGVTVTTLCPGPTATEFQATAKMAPTRLVSRLRMAGSAEVARAAVAAMLAGRTLVVPGLLNRVGTIVVRWLPRRLVSSMVMRMQRPAK